MLLPSPAIQLSADGVSWGAPGAPLQVTAGATFYARLNSTANVDSTTWAVLSTDDLGASPTLTPSGIVSSLVQGAAGVAGTALILQSTINNGVDKTTGQVNPLTTTATVKVWVPAANGLQVICFDEHAEAGAQWWVPLINAAIRGAASGGSGVPTTRTIATTAPLTGGGDLSANRTLAISAATGGAAGSMSAADKTKLDAATATPTASAITKYDAAAGLAANLVTVPANAAPSAPASGWAIYSDSSDGRLKAVSATGLVAEIARLMLTKNSKTLSANNTTANVPVFGVTGSIRVTKLYAVVTTVIGANHTSPKFRLNDQTAQIDITAAGSALSAAPVGSIVFKNGEPGTALFVSPATAGVSGDNAALAPLFQEFFVQQKQGAATNIEYRYSTTDAPTSGVLQFFLEWEPLSADGAVTAL